MSRSRLSALSFLAVVSLSAVSMVSGCADLNPPDPYLTARRESVRDAPLCRSISDALAGKEALIYNVLDSGGLLAAVVNNQVVCVDDAAGVIDSGVIPVTSVPANQAKPDTTGGGVELDGTPLPAESIKTLAGNPSSGTMAPSGH
jgi:hypothetical protein